MDDRDQETVLARDRRQQAVTDDFLHWIAVARELVADHFPSERAEPHNALVIDTARSLMLAHRLGGIEATLEGMKQALAISKEN
ncbi:MAG: hypothetical protein R3E44_05795 [Paracoccaceae bacterium]